MVRSPRYGYFEIVHNNQTIGYSRGLRDLISVMHGRGCKTVHITDRDFTDSQPQLVDGEAICKSLRIIIS